MERNPVIAAEAASDLKGDISKIYASLCFFVPLSLSVRYLISKPLSSLDINMRYIISTLILSSIPLLCCLFFLKFLLRRRISFASYKPNMSGKGFLFYTTAGLISIPATALVSVLTSIIFNFFKLPLSQTYVPKNTAGLIVFFIAYVILPPIIEETIFRSLILERLRRYGDTFAIVLSAALFSLTHSSFQAMPYTFVSGLVFGFITVKTGSCLSAMIVHAVNNLISCVSVVLSVTAGENSSSLFMLGALGAVTIAAVTAIVFRNKSIKHFDFEYKGKEMAIPRKIGITLSGFFPTAFYIITFVYAYFRLILM